MVNLFKSALLFISLVGLSPKIDSAPAVASQPSAPIIKHIKKIKFPHLSIRKILPHPLIYIRRGIASWYGPGFQGKSTASGVIFNTYQPMCAMMRIPLFTWVIVKNIRTGLSTKCQILDHGAFEHYGRIMDLSHAVKQAIGARDLEEVVVYR